MKLSIKVFSKENILYLLLGILFIPISLLIKELNLGFVIYILVTMFVCSFVYFIVLFIKKDKNLIFILDKFKIRLKV